MGGINESNRLRAVDGFGQSSMEESILDVKLTYGPCSGEGQRQYGAHCCGLHHGTERLIVINSGTLSETAENPPSLVLVESAISMKLVAIDPFSSHNVNSRKTRDKIPCAISLESFELLSHGSVPIDIGERTAICLRNRGHGIRLKKK